jgi:c-di-GMP-binding flagellar brake protein YcgR
MSPKDQRLTTRVDSTNLSYYCIDEDHKIIAQGMGRTLNVSTTGILLETYDAIPGCKTVDMEIAMHDDIIKASGIVAHSTEEEDNSYHTGIQFTQISPEDRETIGKFI